MAPLVANHRYISFASKYVRPVDISRNQMFWNWYTLNACFFSTSWRITSNTSFAFTYISVVGLVILLEFLRRLQCKFDRYVAQQGVAHVEPSTTTKSGSKAFDSSVNDPRNDGLFVWPYAVRYRGIPFFCTRSCRFIN